MKKFLVSVAAVAALATSAMAFDVSELSNYDYNGDYNVNGVNSTLQETNTSVGNALIFPAYFVGNGWSSTIRVINTSDNAVVAKVVLYAGKDSHEVRDFNIYLSGHDEFIGKIYQDSDGKFVVESTDDSAPIEGTTSNPYPFADADNPLKKDIDSNYGYIQVIGMMEFSENNHSTANVSFHGKHALMREVFSKLANLERTGEKDPTLVFSNGVILNKKASTPFVNLDQNYTVSDEKTYYDVKVGTDVLTGDIRITDEVNGKDMVMPAVALKYYNNKNDSNSSLVFLEGEKANLADAFIKSDLNYSVSRLNDTLANLGASEVYMTYGDAEIQNNYVLFTSPFKRILVQQALKDKKELNLFTGYSYDENKNEYNYGKFDLLATIYDTSENYMGAGQFSPATTPTITISNEVDNTGYDVNEKTKLPYYLKQAQDQGYTKGYVVLQNVKDNTKIPAIVTQMIATKAGSRTVTNWIVPAQKQ
jgi:hypothetical protein